MSSRIQQVADAIVATLEAAEAANSFSKAIQTERVYDTEVALEDTSVISVNVVPVASNRTRRANGSFWQYVLLDVLVRKRFPQSDFNSAGGVDVASLDEYLELLEQIEDVLADPNNEQLSTYDAATWIDDGTAASRRENIRDLGIRFPWIPKHLTEWHQYTGVLRVAYAINVSY